MNESRELLGNQNNVFILDSVFPYIFVLFTILMFLFSFISFLNPNLIKKQIQLRNQLQGIKSDITPLTLRVSRIMSLVVAIIALLMAWFSYTNFFANPQSFPY